VNSRNVQGIHRLSAAAVQHIRDPGWHSDGGGLYLEVDKNGRKRWAMRLNLGQALIFNGSTNYISVPYASSIDLSGSIMISAWINSNSISAEQAIVAKGTGQDYLFEIISSKLGYQVGGGEIKSTTVLSSNTWYHVVISHPAGGTGTYYVNGAAAGAANALDPNTGTKRSISAATLATPFISTAPSTTSASTIAPSPQPK
jgi:hypothetical protein